MKPICRLFLAVALCLPLAASSHVMAKADYDEEKDHAVLPAGEIVDGPYFAAGKTVEISGTVNGDVYAAGGQVLVDGTIHGDLLAAGGMVSLSGTVDQDVRVAGGQITFNGKIGQNLTAGAGSLELAAPAEIKGGLVAAAGNLRLATPVEGKATLAGGQITITGPIKDDLLAATGELRLSSRAAIGGNLTYWSDQEASIATGAQIAGKIVRKQELEGLLPSTEEVFGRYIGFKLFAALANFTSTLILGFLLVHYSPNFSLRAVEQLQERPLPVLGAGVVILVFTPVLAGLLAITAIGLPLTMVLIAWYLLVLYLVRIFPIYWLGLRIRQKLGRPLGDKGAFVSGLAIYTLLALIPFLGGLVTLVAVVFGLGTILLVTAQLHTELRKQKIM